MNSQEKGGNPVATPQTILVVDDEPALVDVVTYNLRQAGFDTRVAFDGRDAVRLGVEAAPALVVLDLMLPGLDGLAVCRALRQARPTLPIIMLTARDSEPERVLGLEAGADDYVTKPFSPRELVARVRAVLRRAKPSAPPVVLETGARPGVSDLGSGIVLDRPGREVRRDGVAVSLTPTEYRLLETLADHPNRALSRGQLLDLVWDEPAVGDERAVDVHLRHLREKLERDPSEPAFLVTVRGYGYKLRPGGGAP